MKYANVSVFILGNYSSSVLMLEIKNVCQFFIKLSNLENCSYLRIIRGLYRPVASFFLGGDHPLTRAQVLKCRTVPDVCKFFSFESKYILRKKCYIFGLIFAHKYIYDQSCYTSRIQKYILSLVKNIFTNLLFKH